jgi:nucleoid-associated protein YgaU
MFARALAVAVVLVLAWAVLARAGSAAGAERRYVVKAGDTLWSIAAKHYPGDPREAVWRIQQRNGLRGAIIRGGQRLVLP